MDALDHVASAVRQVLVWRRANARARKLLRDHLTLEEQTCLGENGYVVVRGNATGDEYRVWATRTAGNVDRVKDGALFCFYPDPTIAHLPRCDVLLGQILVLRHYEGWVLAKTRHELRQLLR